MVKYCKIGTSIQIITSATSKITAFSDENFPVWEKRIQLVPFNVICITWTIEPIHALLHIVLLYWNSIYVLIFCLGIIDYNGTRDVDFIYLFSEINVL